MVTSEQARDVLAELDAALERLDGRDASLHAAVTILAHRLPHYNWVGVYLLDGGMLNLGPYVGAETEHTLIPVGTGVCGTAVAQNQDIVVDDVRTLDNDLASSVDTRSETVVLIRDAESEQILGLIDAEGHEVGAFEESDRLLLEQVAVRLAPRMWRAD